LLSIGDLSALNNEAGWVEGAWQFWLDPRLGCQMRSGLLDFTNCCRGSLANTARPDAFGAKIVTASYLLVIKILIAPLAKDSTRGFNLSELPRPPAMPIQVGRKPDSAKPTSRPRFRACITSRLGRAAGLKPQA